METLMKNKIILIVLLISLSFNIAVIFKFFTGRREYADFRGTESFKKKPERSFKGCFSPNVGKKISPFEDEIKKDFDSLKRLHKDFFFMLINEDISAEELHERVIEMNNFSSGINKAMGENFIKYRKEISKDFLKHNFPKTKNK